MSTLNQTHSPALKSWFENLPYCVFSTQANPAARVGVAIGDHILDLSVLEAEGLLRPSAAERVFDRRALNPFMALGPQAWSETRARLSQLLQHDNAKLRDDADLRRRALIEIRSCQFKLPAEISGYADFYASKEHASNVGSLFRDPSNPLPANWVHMPIGYNGRPSTIVVSGTPVRRPLGQIKPPNSAAPVFSACQKLDFELEMGAFVGQNSEMGTPLRADQAEKMLFGYVLLNDWSARDIQQWEYVPLGPFQGKVFATSISPFIVTTEALEPFRVAGPVQDPAPLPYLRYDKPANYDLQLEVAIQPERSQPQTISRTNFKYIYWSTVQQLLHHAIGGCWMRVGDLLGGGTVSGQTPDSLGSLLELTLNAKRPIRFADGLERTFLEDGDEVVMRGWCQGNGYRIGFGDVRGKIVPAPSVSFP
jgi:fumarylacetoacetase